MMKVMNDKHLLIAKVPSFKAMYDRSSCFLMNPSLEGHITVLNDAKLDLGCLSNSCVNNVHLSPSCFGLSVSLQWIRQGFPELFGSRQKQCMDQSTCLLQVHFEKP